MPFTQHNEVFHSQQVGQLSKKSSAKCSCHSLGSLEELPSLHAVADRASNSRLAYVFTLQLQAMYILSTFLPEPVREYLYTLLKCFDGLCFLTACYLTHAYGEWNLHSMREQLSACRLCRECSSRPFSKSVREPSIGTTGSSRFDGAWSSFSSALDEDAVRTLRAVADKYEDLADQLLQSEVQKTTISSRSVLRRRWTVDASCPSGVPRRPSSQWNEFEPCDDRTKYSTSSATPRDKATISPRPTGPSMSKTSRLERASSCESLELLPSTKRSSTDRLISLTKIDGSSRLIAKKMPRDEAHADIVLEMSRLKACLRVEKRRQDAAHVQFVPEAIKPDGGCLLLGSQSMPQYPLSEPRSAIADNDKEKKEVQYRGVDPPEAARRASGAFVTEIPLSEVTPKGQLPANSPSPIDINEDLLLSPKPELPPSPCPSVYAYMPSGPPNTASTELPNPFFASVSSTKKNSLEAQSSFIDSPGQRNSQITALHPSRADSPAVPPFPVNCSNRRPTAYASPRLADIASPRDRLLYPFVATANVRKLKDLQSFSRLSPRPKLISHDTDGSSPDLLPLSSPRRPSSPIDSLIAHHSPSSSIKFNTPRSSSEYFPSDHAQPPSSNESSLRIRKASVKSRRTSLGFSIQSGKSVPQARKGSWQVGRVSFGNVYGELKSGEEAKRLVTVSAEIGQRTHYGHRHWLRPCAACRGRKLSGDARAESSGEDSDREIPGIGEG
ncbi:MAG: hypothetical protein MMC23_000994 [Stictis urceolatum]|nr:hypothetical protein [Stictis urceolata]